RVWTSPVSSWVALHPWYARPSGEVQLLPHESRDLLAVGAALRLPHHETDDRADRAHVPLAKLLDGRRVARERPVDDRRDLVALAERAEVLGLDDRRGVAAVGDEAVEHLPGAALGDAA